MDRAPKLPDTSSRLIAMATRLVGSREALRMRMRWSSEQLELYSGGRAEPPIDEFGYLVELVVQEQKRIIEKNRELLAGLHKRQIESDRAK